MGHHMSNDLDNIAPQRWRLIEHDADGDPQPAGPDGGDVYELPAQIYEMLDAVEAWADDEALSAADLDEAVDGARWSLVAALLTTAANRAPTAIARDADRDLTRLSISPVVQS